MSIYKPVKESNEGILERNPLLSVRIEVERHVVVTLNIHKLIVQIDSAD